jgi:hypothetical protein
MKRLIALTLVLAACSGEKKAASTDSAQPAAPAATPGTGTTATPTPAPGTPAGDTKVGGPIASIPQPVGNINPNLTNVVGRVVSVGPDPVSWLAVTAPGGTQTKLEGPLAAEMRGTVGSYIWAEGNHTQTGFVPTAYEVRRVNDKVVDDGIVLVSGTTVSIRKRDGTTREVPNAPSSLRESAGARIWVSKPEQGVAPSWGVIKPKG